jgi:hypothetical protein
MIGNLRGVRVRTFIWAALLLPFSVPALAQGSQQPPEPTARPDFAAAGIAGRDAIISSLYDPGSARVTWTSGFQWGYRKPLIGRRKFGWVACGTVNAKNRLGGYVGAEPFLVFVDENGTVDTGMVAEWVSTCDTGPFSPPMAVLVNYDASAPAPPPTGPSLGVAEELKGLFQKPNLRVKRLSC